MLDNVEMESIGRKRNLGAGSMGLVQKCLSCKKEDLSLYPQNTGKISRQWYL